MARMLRLAAVGYYALTLVSYLALYDASDLSVFHWLLLAAPLALALPLGYAFDRPDALWFVLALPAAGLTTDVLMVVSRDLTEAPAVFFVAIGLLGVFPAGVLMLIGMYAHELVSRWRWRRQHPEGIVPKPSGR